MRCDKCGYESDIDFSHACRKAQAYITQGEVMDLQLEITSLKQQLADAQKDAERYLVEFWNAWQNANPDTHIMDFIKEFAAISAQKEESPPPKNCATCVHGDADLNRQVPCGNCDPNTLSEWKQKESV